MHWSPQSFKSSRNIIFVNNCNFKSNQCTFKSDEVNMQSSNHIQIDWVGVRITLKSHINTYSFWSDHLRFYYLVDFAQLKSMILQNP